MSTFYTGCKVVKRTQETLGIWFDNGGERKRMEFEKEILWLQQSESKILCLHGGKVLEEFSTCNDFYGYLTSIKCAIEEVESKALHFGVTSESSLVFVVRTKVFLEPARETPETDKYNRTKEPGYKSKYAYLPNDWRKEVVVDGQKNWPMLESEMLGEEIVWSSKNSPVENAALVEAFRSKWRIDPVVTEVV